MQHVELVLPEVTQLLPGLTSTWLQPCADSAQQEAMLTQLLSGIRRCAGVWCFYVALSRGASRNNNNRTTACGIEALATFPPSLHTCAAAFFACMSFALKL